MKHLSLAQPHLIVMVGILGSGKSFFAEKFASTFGAPYVSAKKITELTNNGDIQGLALLQLDELLKTKQSVVFDAASDTRTERMTIAKKAREANYTVLYIWVQTDEATAKARVKKETGIDSREYNKIIQRFTPPSANEKPLVISGKHTYASQAKVVLKKLSAPRAEISHHGSSPVRTQRPPARTIMIR